MDRSVTICDIRGIRVLSFSVPILCDLIQFLVKGLHMESTLGSDQKWRNVSPSAHGLFTQLGGDQEKAGAGQQVF